MLILDPIAIAGQDFLARALGAEVPIQHSTIDPHSERIGALSESTNTLSVEKTTDLRIRTDRINDGFPNSLRDH